jgi:hypothetical protein
MRTVECRSQLIIHLISELPQCGESFAVGNLDRNYLDSRTECLVPGVEHRAAASGVMEAEQPHRFTRLKGLP